MKKKKLNLKISELFIKTDQLKPFKGLPGPCSPCASGLDDPDCLDGCPSSSIAMDPCNTQAAYGFYGGMLTGSPLNATIAAASAFAACQAGQQCNDRP